MGVMDVARHKEHWIVFGAGDKPNKGVAVGKSKKVNGYEVRICQLKGDYNYGDEFDLGDITGEYTSLHFCKKESLAALIDALMKTLVAWEKEDEEGRMKIEIEKEDFGTLCICALRYCHGRKSYMPSMVQRIVRNHFNELSAKVLGAILKDEEFQNCMNLWGDDCDKFDWERFYGDLRAYMEEK